MEKKEISWISFAAGKWKAMNKQQWTLVLLAGLLCMVIAMPAGKKNVDISEKYTTSEKTDSYDAYGTELEKHLEEVLGCAEGVGRVRVILMQDEEKDDYFLNNAKKVTGVIVVAEGAGHPVIVQNIKEAVMSLFQVEAHKIKIMKMK